MKLEALIWPKGKCTGTTIAALHKARYSKSFMSI